MVGRLFDVMRNAVNRSIEYPMLRQIEYCDYDWAHCAGSCRRDWSRCLCEDCRTFRLSQCHENNAIDECICCMCRIRQYCSYDARLWVMMRCPLLRVTCRGINMTITTVITATLRFAQLRLLSIVFRWLKKLTNAPVAQLVRAADS